MTEKSNIFRFRSSREVRMLYKADNRYGKSAQIPAILDRTRYVCAENSAIPATICVAICVISSAPTGAPFRFVLANAFGNAPSFATKYEISDAKIVHPRSAPDSEMIKPIMMIVAPTGPIAASSTYAIVGSFNPASFS